MADQEYEDYLNLREALRTGTLEGKPLGPNDRRTVGSAITRYESLNPGVREGVIPHGADETPPDPLAVARADTSDPANLSAPLPVPHKNVGKLPIEGAQHPALFNDKTREDFKAQYGRIPSKVELERYQIEEWNKAAQDAETKGVDLMRIPSSLTQSYADPEKGWRGKVTEKLIQGLDAGASAAHGVASGFFPGGGDLAARAIGGNGYVNEVRGSVQRHPEAAFAGNIAGSIHGVAGKVAGGVSGGLRALTGRIPVRSELVNALGRTAASAIGGAAGGAVQAGGQNLVSDALGTGDTQNVGEAALIGGALGGGANLLGEGAKAAANAIERGKYGPGIAAGEELGGRPSLGGYKIAPGSELEEFEKARVAGRLGSTADVATERLAPKYAESGRRISEGVRNAASEESAAYRDTQRLPEVADLPETPIETALKTGKVAPNGPIDNPGINESRAMYVRTPEGYTKAIFKPAEGESSGSSGISPGTLYRREVGAYQLARRMGIDEVPPTVEREIGGRVGSLQHFRNGRAPEIVGPGSLDELPIGQSDRNVALLDAVTANADRAPRNMLVQDDVPGVDGRVAVAGGGRVAIDNGLAFPPGRPGGFYVAGRDLETPEAINLLDFRGAKALEQANPREVYHSLIRAGVDPESAQAATGRLMALQSNPLSLKSAVESGDPSDRINSASRWAGRGWRDEVPGERLADATAPAGTTKHVSLEPVLKAAAEELNGPNVLPAGELKTIVTTIAENPYVSLEDWERLTRQIDELANLDKAKGIVDPRLSRISAAMRQAGEGFPGLNEMRAGQANRFQKNELLMKHGGLPYRNKEVPEWENMTADEQKHLYSTLRNQTGDITGQAEPEASIPMTRRAMDAIAKDAGLQAELDRIPQLESIDAVRQATRAKGVGVHLSPHGANASAFGKALEFGALRGYPTLKALGSEPPTSDLVSILSKSPKTLELLKQMRTQNALGQTDLANRIGLRGGAIGARAESARQEVTQEDIDNLKKLQSAVGTEAP